MRTHTCMNTIEACRIVDERGCNEREKSINVTDVRFFLLLVVVVVTVIP